jgi:hypothetical protein
MNNLLWDNMEELKNHHLWCYNYSKPCQHTHDCYKYSNESECNASARFALKELNKQNGGQTNNVSLL